ncbi:HNH endonuclease [Agromyces sp. SYSU T00194]|uniref:HNH endonuclease n=1 Tax=Agromyces chitinivorans TaxID=3158560 RepID=UPI0033909A3D
MPQSHDSNSRHGRYSGYRRGCRCEACRLANSAYQREYRARREADGRRLTFRRETVPGVCELCGAKFDARVQRGSVQRWCSDTCCRVDLYGAPAGEGGRFDRFRPSASLRREVLERDAFVCWLCGDPTEPGASPDSGRYPTLDHVVPRARGGSDDPGNLRAAHALCNARKGTRIVEAAHG